MADLQRLVSRVERTIQVFGALQRSHCVRLKGSKFDALFPEEASQTQRDLVWRTLCDQRATAKHDVTVLSGPGPNTYPDVETRVTFLTRPTHGDKERRVQTFIRAQHASGVLTLYEFDPIEWLLHADMTAARIAERVGFYSVATCTVVLAPFDPAREKTIRAAVAQELEKQGSPEARLQADRLCIISLASLNDVEDAAQWHLIIDGAHDLGTERHAEWVDWAKPLRDRGVLRTIDLFAAADLIPTAPGFATATHLSTRPRNAPELANLAMLMLATFFDPAFLLYKYETAADLDKIMMSVMKCNGRVVVVSRLPSGMERRDNQKWIRAYAGAHVKHAALLGDLGVTMQQAREQHTPVLLRAATARAMTLQDWITFLVAVRRRIVVLLRAHTKGEQSQYQLEDFITQARMAYPPLLAGDV